MRKSLIVLVIALLIAVGVYLFWGWILSIILRMFGIGISYWEGSIIVIFIGFVASLFRAKGK